MASKTELSIILKAIDAASGVFSKVDKGLGKLGKKAQAIGKKMTIGLTLPLVAMAGASVKAASTFETGMGNVATLIDTNVESMEEMSAKVLEMSTAADQAAVPLADMTQTLFDLRSGGAEAGEAMERLSRSAKLGVAGLGSTQQAAGLVTGALNAFNLEGEKADRVYNTIFQTTKFGITTIDGLAQSFGSVAAGVAASGTEFDEFMAATSALTTATTPASVAMRQIRSAISSLQKPTKDGQKVLKKLGAKGVQELIKKSGGLVPALVKVNKALGGNQQKLAKVFGNVEGLNAVLALTGKGNEKFTKTLKSMRTSTEDVDIAFAKQNKTAAAGFQRTKNSINAAAISLGTVLAPVASKVAGIITRVANAFAGLDDDTKEVIVTIAAVVAVMGPMVLIVGKLISMFALLKAAIFGGAAANRVLTASAVSSTGAMGASSVAAGKLSKVAKFAKFAGGLTVAALAGWRLGKALDNALGLSDKLAAGFATVLGTTGEETQVEKAQRLIFQRRQDFVARRRRREADIKSGLSPDELASRDAKSRALSIDARNRRARERSEFDAMFGDPELGIGSGGAAGAVERAQGAPGAGGAGGTVEVKFSGVPRGVSVEQTDGKVDLQVGRQLSS